MINTLLQVVLILGLIALSAFFSGSETGFYRLSRFRLRLGVEEHRPFYDKLFSLVRDGQATIMSILIGNNLVSYGLTSLVTVLLFRRLGDQHLSEIYATVILSPVLFVFGEMIPKVLFYHWADWLMPRLAWLLWGVHQAFSLTGIVAALGWVSDRLASLLGLGTAYGRGCGTPTQTSGFPKLHSRKREIEACSHAPAVRSSLQIPNVPVHTCVTPYPECRK